MSKSSARKKARRRRRWARVVHALDITDVIFGVGESYDGTVADEVAELWTQATSFDQRITQRGWIFDADNAVRGLACWYFGPSGIEPDDDDTESVTRMYFTVGGELGDRQDFPEVVHVIFVGTGAELPARRMAPDRFVEHLDAIEAYRVGDPPPALG